MFEFFLYLILVIFLGFIGGWTFMSICWNTGCLIDKWITKFFKKVFYQGD